MDERGTEREGRWALLLLGLGVVAVFVDGLLGRAPVMRDFVGFTYPSRAAFRAVLGGGDLSSWNSLSELGLSRLAAPVHGALYPGHLLLRVGTLETGVVITWVAHVVWAGLGGYLLGRIVGGRPVAALISGAIWAFGGYAVSMWWNGEKVLTGAWLPWFALGVERASAARGMLSRGSVLAAVALAMICYAGDTFLLLHAVALAVAVVLARPAAASGRRRAAELGRALLATVLGLGLAAPVLLCALYARGDTSRNEPLAPSVAQAWSFYPARFAEFFVPGWFGNPFDVEHYQGAAFAAEATRQVLPWAVSVYAGAAVLLFVPCVRNRRALAWLGGAAALFFLLACGRHTPLNALFCRVVPGLALFRYPEKHLVVTIGLLALLASMGAEEALAKHVAIRRLLAPGVIVIASVTLLSPPALRATAIAGALHLAVASLLLVACLHLARVRPAWSFAVGVVAVLDLALAARPFLRWEEPPLFASPYVEPLASRFAGAPPRIYRPRSADFEDPATFPGAAGQLFGIAALPGHDPASSLRLRALMSRLADRPAPMVQLLAIDALVLPSDVSVDMTPAASHGGTSLYLLPRPPRAWIVGSVRIEDAGAALGVIASEGFDPYAEGVVAPGGDADVLALASRARGRAGDCAIAVYDRARVDLQCDAERDGLVVVSELYADGWTATLDGREARLLPADLVLRGVAVPPGLHRISMRYETPGLAEGITVAAATMLLLLLGLSLSRIRTVHARTSRPLQVRP
jgi:hypothetical protein